MEERDTVAENQKVVELTITMKIGLVDLKKQKLALISAQSALANRGHECDLHHADNLDGTLNLLDTIQDYISDQKIADEKEIYVQFNQDTNEVEDKDIIYPR